MATINLGKVAMTPRGEYDVSVAYEALDIIRNNGASYIVVKDAPAGTSTENTEYFCLISRDGRDGANGNTPDLLTLWPVGSIYFSEYDDDQHRPSALFGGSWERIKEKFLFGATDENGVNGNYPAYLSGQRNTGGSSTHVHVLGADGYAKLILRGAGRIDERYIITTAYTSNYSVDCGDGSGGSYSSYNCSEGIELGGKTNSANSMPPWIAVYMWRRVA